VTSRILMTLAVLALYTAMASSQGAAGAGRQTRQSLMKVIEDLNSFVDDYNQKTL
jgi:hypothetical protein